MAIKSRSVRIEVSHSELMELIESAAKEDFSELDNYQPVTITIEQTKKGEITGAVLT